MTVGRLPSIEGGIQPTIVDAKGDLIAAVAADTPARIGVGSNGQLLSANSSTATGLEWVTPTGGGSNFVALNSTGTTLTGSSTSVTGLSGYDKYYVMVVGASSNAGASITLTLNSDTTSKYGGGALSLNASTGAINIVAGTFNDLNGDTSMALGYTAASGAINATLSISGGNSSGAKIIDKQAGVSSIDGNYVTVDTMIYTGTSVISSIQIRCSSGTFDNGKIIIYGSL